VEVNLDDFRRHFELLSDETLLSTNRDDLVESARGCYDEEVERRGLNAADADATEEALTGQEGIASPDSAATELVTIATFNIPEEASLARGLLESAGIPYHLDNEHAALGGIQLRLTVPKAFEEEAIEILEMEISEEDLAAQAEAAGLLDEESEKIGEESASEY
jgi:hypothetical protein